MILHDVIYHVMVAYSGILLAALYLGLWVAFLVWVLTFANRRV